LEKSGKIRVLGRPALPSGGRLQFNFSVEKLDFLHTSCFRDDILEINYSKNKLRYTFFTVAAIYSGYRISFALVLQLWRRRARLHFWLAEAAFFIFMRIAPISCYYTTVQRQIIEFSSIPGSLFDRNVSSDTNGLFLFVALYCNRIL